MYVTAPAMPWLGVTNAITGAENTDALPDNYDNPVDALKQVIDNNNQIDEHLNGEVNQFKNYIDGLITSVGEENKLNRDYNSAEAVLNREFQSAEAQKQRDWYEAMSNSAYQRAVADMEAAGINPILAFSQGGAASSGTGIGAGSAASYNVASGDTLSSVLSAVAQVITSVSGASANKFDKAYKMLKMFM